VRVWQTQTQNYLGSERTYTEHDRLKPVTALDVVDALKRQGRTIRTDIRVGIMPYQKK
jgi:hypothetical protein